MAEVKISGMPTAAPLTGAESIEVVQDGSTAASTITKIFEDSTGKTTIARNGRQLVTGDGETVSVSWELRELYDHNGVEVILAMNWKNRTLHDDAGTSVVLWGQGLLRDGSSLNALNWQNRQLVAPDDYRALDWEERQLFNSNDNPSLDWSDDTTLQVTPGIDLALGNNAVTGLTPGVLAATTNATIVIKDASGQAYRIPCII